MLGVTAIIRLSESLYNKADAVRAGFHFYDLFLQDGTTPSHEFVHKFLEIC